MITITKIFEFAAAHCLPHHGGACFNLHGHNYKLEVTITGPTQDSGCTAGMIMDFEDFKKTVKNNILSKFDHSNLNSLFDNPTAEIIVEAIANQMGLYFYRNIRVTKIRLWETSTSYATWRPECLT